MCPEAGAYIADAKQPHTDIRAFPPQGGNACFSVQQPAATAPDENSLDPAADQPGRNLESSIMSKPSIVVNKSDHARLLQLANGLLDRKPEMAEELLTELDRARVVEKGAVLQGTVQMGSAVEYQTNDGQARRVILVYPGEADISQGKVSILTPIGTALLGLKAGQSIDWVANDGRSHRLTIVSVTAPEASAEQ